MDRDQLSTILIATINANVVRSASCGAGGAYSVFQPELADQIRARKLSSIQRAAPDVVASANPGCSMHLAAKGVPTVHPMQLVDRALQSTDPTPDR